MLSTELLNGGIELVKRLFSFVVDKVENRVVDNIDACKPCDLEKRISEAVSIVR